MIGYDLTTFVAEGIEDSLAVQNALDNAVQHYWIKPFPNGLLNRDVSAAMGRDAFECLVNRQFRELVSAAFADIHYTLIEGE